MNFNTIRRKLFYVPLAMHLTLQGCATAQLLSPATPPVLMHDVGSQALTHSQVIDTGEQGTHAVSITVAPPTTLDGASHYELMTMPTSSQHRWVATDVVKYTLSLKVQNATNGWDDVVAADMNQKGSNISTQATFTGLTAGKTYKVFMQTYGNNGGNTSLSTTLIDGQNAQASNEIGFTGSNDVQDSYTVTLAPTLDNTVFNGQIGVSVAAPVAGNYTTTMSPTYSLSTTNSYTGTLSIAQNNYWYGGLNTSATVSYASGTVTITERVSGTSTVFVGQITGYNTATFPGHSFTLTNYYNFVLDGISFSDNL